MHWFEWGKHHHPSLSEIFIWTKWHCIIFLLKTSGCLKTGGNHQELGGETQCRLLNTQILKGSGNPLNSWGSRENWGKLYLCLPCPALPQTSVAATCGKQNTKPNGPLFWAAVLLLFMRFCGLNSNSLLKSEILSCYNSHKNKRLI